MRPHEQSKINHKTCDMIQSKTDYNLYLEKDRVSTGVPKYHHIVQKIHLLAFPPSEWVFIKSLRRLEYCENVLKKHRRWGGVICWFIAKCRYRRLSIKYGYSIPINVFGPGLSLAHRGNIVINAMTQIGENCRIHVGVNIGAHRNKAPRIGNNVYIGPGAILFGDIEIADNVSIGANATVCKSILEPNSVVVGTPAKIIKRGVKSWNEQP